MMQTFFKDSDTEARLCSGTGVVQVIQEDESVKLTPEDAVLLAFHVLYYLAPELLDEQFRTIEEGTLLAVGLPTGNLFLTLHPTEPS